VRLGIFGGSFDPPHIGHYLAAVDAAEQLGLDQLIWVPAAQQPLKTGTPHKVSAEHRFRMTAAAASAHPNFRTSRIEIDRKGLSYTVTTVEAFAREYPDAERFLMVGEDAWAQFDRWREPDRIRTFVRIAVLARLSENMSWVGAESAGSPSNGEEPDVRLKTRLVDVSSTEIRRRAQGGKSVRGFVQDAVAEIIESEGLYRW
jgi:nicotinate-nucleotide adenylyltransferase